VFFQLTGIRWAGCSVHDGRHNLAGSGLQTKEKRHYSKTQESTGMLKMSVPES
jgi:hypothetical protein